MGNLGIPGDFLLSFRDFVPRAQGLPEPVACARPCCCPINTLKSGEFRNRALLLAKEMAITLQRVFIVPSGKGHLTNAFGMSSAIGLTDNLGKYLTKEQVHSKNRGYRLGRTRASRTLSRHPRGRRVGDPAAPGPQRLLLIGG